MKITKTTSKAALTAAALALCVGNLHAEDSMMDRSDKKQAATSKDAPRSVTSAENYDRGQSAKDLRGRDVIGSDGEKLGSIKDFAVDTHSGQIVFAIVGSGGVLGIGEKQRAVPYSALSAPTANKNGGARDFNIGIDKAKWELAPLFADAGFTSFTDEEQNRQLFSYYGQDWASLDRDRRVGPRQDHAMDDAAKQSRQLMLISKVTGRDVMQEGRKVGQIQDVVIHEGSRSASLLLDTNRDFAGVDQRFLMPFGQVAISPDESQPLTTALAAADFARAAPMSRDAWDAPSGRPYVWTGYGYPTGAPGIYSEGDLVLSDRGQREMTEPVRTTERPRSQLSGEAVVTAAKQAIERDEALRESAKNVQVTTREDHVVLRGSVPSKEAKDQVEDKVEEVAEGWNIDNEISVQYATD